MTTRSMFPWLAALALVGCGDDGAPPEEPPPPDVQAFMTGYFATFDRYVLDDIMALYSPGVHAEISGLGELDGAAEVRDTWLVPFTSAFPDYTHDVDTLTVEGQTATADFVDWNCDIRRSRTRSSARRRWCLCQERSSGREYRWRRA